MRKKFKNNIGITLIALIIMIIVLLILAGVSIVALTGEGRILNKATRAKTQGEQSTIEEELKIAIMALQMNYYENQNGGNFRDFLFTHEEELKKELGNSTIKMDSEAKIITKDGIQFSVDEDGNIAKIEGISLSEKKKILNRLEGKEENPEAELVATLVTIQGDITWKSSNEEIVKITGSGNKITITGLKDGTAIITASCQGEEASCEVTVKTLQITTELTLNPTDLVIRENETSEILAIQNGTEEIKWESSDENTAKIIENTGNKVLVKGIKDGEATITAKTHTGTLTASCNVYVGNINRLEELDVFSDVANTGNDFANYGFSATWSPDNCDRKSLDTTNGFRIGKWTDRGNYEGILTLEFVNYASRILAADEVAVQFNLSAQTSSNIKGIVKVNYTDGTNELKETESLTNIATGSYVPKTLEIKLKKDKIKNLQFIISRI